MWSDTQRILLFALAIGAIAATLWLVATLFTGLLVLFAGALFAVFLKCTADRVSRTLSINYEPAFALVVAVLLICCGASAYFMGSQIAGRVEEFFQQFDEARSRFAAQFASNNWRSQVVGVLAPETQRLPITSGAISTATSAASTVVEVIGGGILVLFLGFYFALQPTKYRNGFLAVLPKRFRSRIDNVLVDSSTALWKWILGRLVGMFAIGIFSASGLWIIGIPLPATLGVMAGVLNFVPNVGPIISAIPPIVFGTQMDGNALLYVILLYLGLQFVESYFLTPLITQHQVALPPGLTLSTQLLFGLLAGFLGLLLATPITVVAHVFVRGLYLEQDFSQG